ncbi:MAG: hypothetical protein AAFP03_00980 [Cyanobacteria bacterium J06598_3]
MKVFLAGLAITAAAIGGGIGYAGMKTASTPAWYDSESSETSSETSSTNITTTIKDRILGTQGQKTSASESPYTANGSANDTTRYEEANYPDGTYPDADPSDIVVTPHTQPAASSDDVVISEGELSQMMTQALASQPYTAPILEAAQDIRTSLDDGRLESGVVMNLSKLPVDALPAEGQQVVEQLTQTFPFLANRDVYLGIEGSPTIVEGKFSLDDTHIKVGQLKLPVANVASQLGISQTDIENQLGAVLEQQGLTPDNIQIVDGQLVIRGINQ